jgi:hypothetical protein
VIAAACAAGLLLVAPALAPAATTTTVQGTAAPGTPPELNKVFVTKYGPAKGDRVLVLIPGFLGSVARFLKHLGR